MTVWDLVGELARVAMHGVRARAIRAEARKQLSRLRYNLPSAKPELWQDLPRAARRRLVAWLSSTLDPGWGWRPLLTTIEPEGLLLEVLPREIGCRAIVYYGVYEYAPTTLVRAFLKPGDTFVDVGANIGYFSMLGAALVGPAGRVIAFEPSRAVRERLSRSKELNGFSHVQIHPDAVGAAAGQVTLIEPAGENHGLAYVVNEVRASGSLVRCVRLDEELLSAPPVALIKVDVEGGEAAVFEGARGLLARPDAPCILYESFHVETDRRLLDELGYESFAVGLDRGRLCLRPIDEADRLGYRPWEAPNYFALKSERGREFKARYVASPAAKTRH